MAAPKTPRKTRRYSNDFKSQAVLLSMEEERTAKEVAESLGIHPAMLWRWRQKFREGLIVPDKRKKVLKKPKPRKKPETTTEAQRIKELERQVAELEKENDLLKKWQRFLAEKKQNDSNS
jgi:transposase